jgi:hypothetical protein
MFLIREINPLSFKLLERIYRQSRHHQVPALRPGFLKSRDKAQAAKEHIS